MRFRISGLLAIAAFVACLLGSAESLAQNAYITNSGDNTVSVIDTATNTVTATIPVGNSPFGVAVRCRRDLCWNLFGAISGRTRIVDQAARSIGLSASFWPKVCHPSTLRMVI
jgi:YVTN family beta-propeller protein